MAGLIKSTAVRIPKPINADGSRLTICMNRQMAELGFSRVVKLTSCLIFFCVEFCSNFYAVPVQWLR